MKTNDIIASGYLDNQLNFSQILSVVIRVMCVCKSVFGGVVASRLVAEEDFIRGSQRFNVVVASPHTSDAEDDAYQKRDVDLAYCSVKTGVNDLLDYMALAVSLIIPLVIGPLVVGVFQVSILCTVEPFIYTVI